MSSQSSRVALVRCDDYDASRVEEAVARGLSLLGGMGAFVRPGERILLKPNLLAATPPAKAVTTHPAVFASIAKQAIAEGARVSYGDSPGFGRPEFAAKRAGLAAVAGELSLALADFVHGKAVSNPDGHQLKQFTLAQGVLDCDGLVSLPKLKTHALTRVTGAIKNQFGCIPGFLKGEFHARMSEMDRFARMLVDLTAFIRPRLFVMDAIVAMEGNGPRSGHPRPVRALLFSPDPVALDAVACRLINLEPVLVPATRWGAEMGLGTFTDVELVGDSIAPLVVADFKVNREKEGKRGVMPAWLAKPFRDLIVPRPAIVETRCTACGTCVKVCPITPKAVDFRGDPVSVQARKPPVYEYARCIRCYCCQEMCPESAIHVETPWLGRWLHRT